MSYAVSLKCIDDTALPVRELWRQAGRFEAVPSMEALHYPPHITLGIYRDITLDRLIPALHAVLDGTAALPIEFSDIGHFRNDDLVLWLRPADADRLHELHDALHHHIDPALCHEHYRPGAWIPHCTIATAIPTAASEAALAWAAAIPVQFTLRLTCADCVEFPPVRVIREIALIP
jgi:2'-5' RNA ligase